MDETKEYKTGTIMNRLTCESLTSKYNGCIISHYSLIGKKIRPMLIIEARRGHGHNNFLITALPISSKVGSYPILMNNDISYVLFLPETIVIDYGHLRHVNQCRLSAVEFTNCLDYMHSYYKREPEIFSKHALR